MTEGTAAAGKTQMSLRVESDFPELVKRHAAARGLTASAFVERVVRKVTELADLQSVLDRLQAVEDRLGRVEAECRILKRKHS